MLVILFLLNLFSNSKISQFISLKGLQFANVVSGVLVLNTNDYRSKNNENTLVQSSLLTEAAQMKADDMAKKSYFSHIGPGGEKPWVWFEKVGYKYEYAGENLAVDFTESNDVSLAWINSAKHKANLLNTNFTEIGVGIADGVYQGKNTTFVVQFFGKPFVGNKNVPKEKKVLPTVVKTMQLVATSSPTTAVVTRNDLPSGVVLGARDTSVKKGNIWVWLLGISTPLVMIGCAIYVSMKK